jgi:hypothetical protein
MESDLRQPAVNTAVPAAGTNKPVDAAGTHARAPGCPVISPIAARSGQAILGTARSMMVVRSRPGGRVP